MWFSVARIILFIFCGTNLVMVFCGTNIRIYILRHEPIVSAPHPPLSWLIQPSSQPTNSQPAASQPANQPASNQPARQPTDYWKTKFVMVGHCVIISNLIRKKYVSGSMLMFCCFSRFGMVPHTPGIICHRFFNNRRPLNLHKQRTHAIMDFRKYY